MNKLNTLVVICLLFAVCACSLLDSKNKSRNAPTTANNLPVAGKSPDSTDQPGKTNDNKPASGSGNKDVAELEEIVGKDTKNHQAYFQLGKKYQMLKTDDKAIAAYKKSIEIKPDYPEANFALGKMYFDKKDFETSLPFLKEAAKLSPKSSEYLVAAADNYRELKQCNFAVPHYGNSINFDDKNPAAYYGMGLCYLELKNRIAAESQIRPLEKLDKNMAKQLETKIKQY